MAELSFEQQVKIELVKRNMTQNDLCNAITEQTGLYCDHSLLHRIYNGQLAGVKVKNAICDILGICFSNQAKNDRLFRGTESK